MIDQETSNDKERYCADTHGDQEEREIAHERGNWFAAVFAFISVMSVYVVTYLLQRT